jgi:hypothetical protein
MGDVLVCDESAKWHTADNRDVGKIRKPGRSFLKKTTVGNSGRLLRSHAFPRLLSQPKLLQP